MGVDEGNLLVMGVERYILTIRVRYIDYTESGENHGTMILDGVCYSVIHFCRVILWYGRALL